MDSICTTLRSAWLFVSPSVAFSLDLQCKNNKVHEMITEVLWSCAYPRAFWKMWGVDSFNSNRITSVQLWTFVVVFFSVFCLVVLPPHFIYNSHARFCDVKVLHVTSVCVKCKVVSEKISIFSPWKNRLLFLRWESCGVSEIHSDQLSALIFMFFCAGGTKQYSSQRWAHKGRRSYSTGAYFHLSDKSIFTPVLLWTQMAQTCLPLYSSHNWQNNIFDISHVFTKIRSCFFCLCYTSLLFKRKLLVSPVWDSICIFNHLVLLKKFKSLVTVTPGTRSSPALLSVFLSLIMQKHLGGQRLLIVPSKHF